jgi:hypothetical protein
LAEDFSDAIRNCSSQRNSNIKRPPNTTVFFQCKHLHNSACFGRILSFSGAADYMGAIENFTCMSIIYYNATKYLKQESKKYHLELMVQV